MFCFSSLCSTFPLASSLACLTIGRYTCKNLASLHFQMVLGRVFFSSHFSIYHNNVSFPDLFKGQTMPGNRAKWMLRKVLQIAITILKQWRCLEKYGQSYVCRGPNILFIFPGACRRERPYTVAGRSLHVIPIFMLDTVIANRHQTTLHSFKVGLNPKGKPHHKTRRVLSLTFHKKVSWGTLCKMPRRPRLLLRPG